MEFGMNHVHLWNKLRIGFLTLAVAAFAAVSFAPSAADAAVSIPIKAKDFEGTLNITRFVPMTVGGNTTVGAVGSIVGVGKGKLKADKDTAGIIAVGGLIFPVTLGG